jgi:hypothetical protein
MKVRLTGFTFEIENASPQLSMDAFVRFVNTGTDELDGEGEGKRLLFMNADHDADYFVGLVVTVKDHRAYCELVSEAGGMRLKVNDVAEGSHLMDFNFFVFHKTTYHGLYQHYHQSCSPGAFARLCGERFRDYRTTLADNAVAALPVPKTDAAERRARSPFMGYLRSAVIVRQEALEAMIQEMRRVKSFQYAISTPVVEEKEFRPLARWIKKKVHKISFSVDGPVHGIATAISRTVERLGIDRGRVEGVDQDGIKRVLRIVDNPDTFGEYDYDDVASRINDLNLSQFHESWAIRELLDKARENAHILEVEMRP